MQQPRRADPWRSAVMLVVYVAALLAGRAVTLPDATVSLLWPAAGVAVWWFTASRSPLTQVVDAGLVVAATTAVNVLTAVPPPVAVAFGGVNLAHGLVGASLLHRLGAAHGLRGAAGPVKVVLASTGAGVVSGLLAAWVARYLADGSLVTFLLVAPRNTASTIVVLLVVVGVVRTGRTPELWRREGRAEWLLAGAVGTALYLALFFWQPGLPLSFAVLPIVIWSGARLGLPRTIVLSVLLGALAVAGTVDGSVTGPFSDVQPPALRAGVVQLFVVVTVLAGVVLAGVQEERARLAQDVAAARATLAASIDAALIGNALVRTGGEQVGWLLHLNPALRRLLRTDLSPPGTSAAAPGEVSWFSFLREEDVAEVRQALRDVADGRREAWTGELAHLRGDRSVVWAQVHVSPIPDGRAALAVAQFLDVTARKDAEAQLSHLALHDELTGLPNRVLLRDRIEVALDAAQRSGGHVAILFLDVDHFKAVNDSLGHEAGDELLRIVAQRLRALLRPADTVARIGGDEFVACLPGVSGVPDAEVVAQRLVDAVSRPVRVQGRRLDVGVSAGLTVSGPEDDASTLLRHSDAAMYAAKRAGRGRLATFEQQLVAQASRHLSLSAELRDALVAEQFVLHYQPIVDLGSGAVVACEALVRWQHPTRGLLLPGEWLDVAEQSDVVVRLGAWVLRRAARDVAGLAELVGPLAVHVNVSGRQLAQPGLVQEVAAVLEESALPAHLVVLELTETHLVELHHSLLRDLGELNRLGVRLAVDDFGTGYSSLTQVVRLPVDCVKVDRSFVRAASRDDKARAVVQAVVGMAAAVGLDVVAEGVETPAEEAMLRDMGCLSGQGFLWFPPMGVDRLRDLLQGRRSVPSPRDR